MLDSRGRFFDDRTPDRPNIFREPCRTREPTTPSLLSGLARPSRTLALCRVTMSDAAVWGPPLMYHSGNPVTLRPATKMVPASTSHDLFPLQKAVLNGPVQRTPWPCSAVLPMA